MAEATVANGSGIISISSEALNSAGLALENAAGVLDMLMTMANEGFIDGMSGARLAAVINSALSDVDEARAHIRT